jgi:hypothetical protein
MMCTRLAKPLVCLLVVAGAVAAASGCAATGRPGKASSYLVVDSLLTEDGSTTLASDVLTGGGFLEDAVSAAFHVEMKDPTAVGPSPVNAITLRGYRVTYTRADGRNTPGVDVPYAFDGAMSATVTGSATVSVVLVRAQAKLEAPLLALRNLGGALAIATFADVVFYGADQAGRDVTVTARMGVTVADWGEEG